MGFDEHTADTWGDAQHGDPDTAETAAVADPTPHGPSLHATFINSTGHPAVFTIWDATLHQDANPDANLFHGSLGDGDQTGPYAFYPEHQGAERGYAGVRLHGDAYGASPRMAMPITDGSTNEIIFGHG